ncbi:MAG: hypothetical protein O3A65_08310 [Proteobacteria bacterium]|nr:hypothetical protein [Pseudomonadota bacterium]
MDFENWWLLAFPLFFFLGWLAAKIDIRQLMNETRQIPSIYIEGLNFLLNQERDKAVEVLVKLSLAEPDSVELQFAVGVLFRDKGEIQRALAVHQGLLDRPELTGAQRNRAILAVGQDFFKAGMHDRAEEFLKRVGSKEYAPEALKLMMDLYVNRNDWVHAVEVARKLQETTGESKGPEIAHFMVEIALSYQGKEDYNQALYWLYEALSENPIAPRPRIVLGDILKGQGRYHEAIHEWGKLEHYALGYLGLVVDSLIECHDKLGSQKQCLEKLKGIIEIGSNHDVLVATFKLSLELEGHESARALARKFLKQTSNVTWAIPILELIKKDSSESYLDDVNLLIEVAKQYGQDSAHVCDNCGFRAQAHYWRCPACRLVDTYVPTSVQAEGNV